MSRIGSVAVELNDVSVVVCQTVRIIGPLGQLTTKNHPALTIELRGSVLLVRTQKTDRRSSAIQGTMRALIHNSVRGVTSGFRRALILTGVGYRASVADGTLQLHLGYTNTIHYQIGSEVKIATKSPTEIIVSGLDKQTVGQVCADIRSYRPVEPYKGKGIRYDCEIAKTKEKKKGK